MKSEQLLTVVANVPHGTPVVIDAGNGKTLEAETAEMRDGILVIGSDGKGKKAEKPKKPEPIKPKEEPAPAPDGVETAGEDLALDGADEESPEAVSTPAHT